jgi:hypothetical protein
MLERPKTSRVHLRNIGIAVIVSTLIGLSLFFFVYVPFTPCPGPSVEGYALYVKVVNDVPTGSSVAGARVGGSYLSTCTIPGSGTTKTMTSALSKRVTPTANGTVTIMPVNPGNYSIIVQYNGEKYTFDTYVRPIYATNVTLSVPSGVWNVTYTDE